MNYPLIRQSISSDGNMYQRLSYSVFMAALSIYKRRHGISKNIRYDFA